MINKLPSFILLFTVLLSSCNGRTQIEENKATFVNQHPCRIAGNDALCGNVPVYENRNDKSGRVINLNLVVIKATRDNPEPDPVFFLAGGPGEAATESTGNIQFLDQILDGKRDIVLVDQRGTGGSNKVTVPPTPDFSGLSPNELETQFSKWLEKVLSELDMDPRYYTTSVAMDDLDEVRQALGYEKINLYGGSYGATAAQYYLRQYEDRVRTVTLVAGSLLDVPLFELEAKHAQRTLDLMFKQCEADKRCHSAFPNLQAEFNELLKRLEQNPAEVTINDNTVVLTRDLFAARVEWITRDASRITALPFWIHQAYETDRWAYFAQAGSHGFGSDVMPYIIRCSEKWATFTLDGIARQSPDSYLSNWSVGQAMQLAPVCKYVPPGETPEGVSPQPASEKPVLLFNGEWDILDPPENVAGAPGLWPNSLSLTIPWQSHELSNYSATHCMRDIVSDFIDHASVDELDASCLKTIASPIFKTK